MHGPPQPPRDDDSARFGRALRAHLRQEFTAPSAAILGYAEMLIEDAKRSSFADMVADLDRIHMAGVNLNAVLQSALDDQPGRALSDPTKLRHDLRTPINAIKGYGEMLLEDAVDDGQDVLVGDLQRLLAAATGMLARIDALVDFTGQPRQTETIAHHADTGIVAALRSIGVAAPKASSPDLVGRILVVDDNASNRDLLDRQLVRQGHTVLQAEGGREALAMLDREAVDLVLLDLMMPDLSGYDVLTILKSQPHTSAIPVIVISALDELASIIRCIEAGAVDYLPKPFDKTLLHARLASTIENKKLRDREALMLRRIQEEKERSEALLQSILPCAIIDRINDGATMISDHIPEATILFADIVGFTPLAARLRADELIAFLDSIFAGFDELADRFGAEKIKTIGDAYMAALGLPEPREDHAIAAAHFARAMIETVERVATETGTDIKVRVGIHCGPVVAGVIGRKKFSYDCWGQTVNTASRMESHGVPGRINISHNFASRLGGAFELHDRGEIELKGSGKLHAYFLGAPCREEACLAPTSAANP